MKRAALVLALAACKRDPLEDFVDRACACETAACSDAVIAELDAWIDRPGDHGAHDRDRTDVLMHRFETCHRRFEGARRASYSKSHHAVLPTGTPITIGQLIVPSPAGFGYDGVIRFVADGLFEWTIEGGDPADDAERWLRTVWPIAILSNQYRHADYGPIEQLAAPAGWQIVARSATAEDRGGTPIYYMLIAAYHPDRHRVYASEIEAPAPVDPVLRAAVLQAIAGIQLK